jgi:biopolymer transport protein ExbB/TolQ
MMDAVQHILYALSNALLFPALLGILGMAVWTMLLFGGFVREWFTRPAVRKLLRETRRSVQRATVLPPEEVDREGLARRLGDGSSGLPARFIFILRQDVSEVPNYEKALDDLEGEVAAALARLTWLTRVAPMLGLMGTLIPLGPALTGLASGNVAVLSSNLVVAFTATVLGVLIGCCSFSMALVRKHWYQHDMGELEYIFTHETAKPSPSASKQP